MMCPICRLRALYFRKRDKVYVCYTCGNTFEKKAGILVRKKYEKEVRSNGANKRNT